MHSRFYPRLFPHSSTCTIAERLARYFSIRHGHLVVVTFPRMGMPCWSRLPFLRHRPMTVGPLYMHSLPHLDAVLAYLNSFSLGYHSPRLVYQSLSMYSWSIHPNTLLTLDHGLAIISRRSQETESPYLSFWVMCSPFVFLSSVTESLGFSFLAF